MKLNEILGTEFPIIQGGMANIATGEFAAAVSNAGAMGLIGAGGMSADTFREKESRALLRWSSSRSAMASIRSRR